MRNRLLLVCAAALSITPAAAQQGRYLDPRDVAEAQRDNAAIVAELGGAETGPRAAYVDSVGRRVANFSGVSNPGQAFHFTTLNSAVENALSVPGGYVYVTRQLLALMDDEAQLAFALGHEVGHIAANHARQREEAERRATWRALPEILLGRMIGGGFGNAIATRGALSAQLRTLGFSRDQEYQSDVLGIRYMIAAGYDPAGAGHLLSALTRTTALETRVQGQTNRQSPEWASTHPLSENRMQRAFAAAQATGRLGVGTRNRDAYLAQIEGLYVDDDPEQGIIDGPLFTHPDLRIQFRVPSGYLMSNGTRAVTISGSAGKAQFGGGRFNGSLDSYIFQVIRELTGGRQIPVPPPGHTVINGLPAAFTTARVNGSSGVIDLSVVAYQWDSQNVYHFIMLTQGGSGTAPFVPMINSLRKITATEASAIRPRVIHVVTAAPGDTVQSLASRMAYRDYKLDRFLALNGLAANSRLVPGQKLKLVVYGTRQR